MSVVNGVVLHADTDGYRHVPANGTTNSGKFLVSGGSAGSYTWETIAAGSLPVHAFRHHYNGSDPLAGQSIAGLLISSSPEFAGLKIGSISGMLAATSGVVRLALASDVPGISGTLNALANANGVLRNTGAGVLSWQACLPIQSYSTLELVVLMELQHTGTKSSIILVLVSRMREGLTGEQYSLVTILINGDSAKTQA